MCVRDYFYVENEINFTMVSFKTVHPLTYNGFCLREQYLKQASRLIEKLCHKEGVTISVCSYLSSEFCHKTKFLTTLCKSTFHKKRDFFHSTVPSGPSPVVCPGLVSAHYTAQEYQGFSH